MTQQKPVKLTIPFEEKTIRSLNVGDSVLLTGTIFTARDEMHKFIFNEGKIPFDLREGVIYHCGPIVKKAGTQWNVISAGPTTSAREELFEAKVIELTGVRAIIGKGGMGDKTRDAMRAFGCVYLHAVGGAAVLLAKKIKRVEGVFGLKEFGAPEAMWKLRVEEFPAIVSMDANGNSLHEEILKKSKENAEKEKIKKFRSVHLLA